MSAGSGIRVRFAPSPTGHLHVGNARTALFNWLFARKHSGTFILRVEDTDEERSETRFETQLITDLKWLDLDWDEGPDVGGEYGPYRQSDRLHLYREQAERLLREGTAYLCFCSAEELQQDRDRALAEHRQPNYSGKCRALDPVGAERRRATEPCAVRLKIPEHPIRFHDIVRGDVEFASESVSDPIILRSNGMPVYNYVVVIDDALMKITHVVRGDDHLSNTPKQVALYEALGWPVPQFAHLSTILGSDRERLSKRHGATSIANFREMGIVPEALMNYLALLGWAPSGGDREIFSKDELVREFDLARVTPSPAIFDFEKLYWLNRHYIKERLPFRVFPPALPFFVRAGYVKGLDGLQTSAGDADLEVRLEPHVAGWFVRLTELLAPYVDRLDQLPERAAFIFDYDPRAAIASPDNAELLAAPSTRAVIEAFAKRLADGPLTDDPLSAERFKAIVNEVKLETGVKGKYLFHPIRLALTGSHSGPDFDKVVPLIEEGSKLELPRRVMNVRQRVRAFLEAWRG